MGIKVRKTISTDNIEKLKQILATLGSKKIKIGIFGSEGSEILMIATVNEFGCDITITNKMRWWLRTHGLPVKDTTESIHIPERSFIRKTANEKQDEISTFIKSSLNMLFSFQIDADTFLKRIGIYLAQITQQTLTNTTDPANHPFTIMRKDGKEHPLIDSGRLRESITYQIE